MVSKRNSHRPAPPSLPLSPIPLFRFLLSSPRLPRRRGRLLSPSRLSTVTYRVAGWNKKAASLQSTPRGRASKRRGGGRRRGRAALFFFQRVRWKKVAGPPSILCPPVPIKKGRRGHIIYCATLHSTHREREGQKDHDSTQSHWKWGGVNCCFLAKERGRGNRILNASAIRAPTYSTKIKMFTYLAFTPVFSACSVREARISCCR